MAEVTEKVLPRADLTETTHIDHDILRDMQQSSPESEKVVGKKGGDII